MNSKFLGDSYDIVKRFVVEAVDSLGYSVYVDPMPTGDWAPSEAAFLRLVGARHVREHAAVGKSALLLDPDTGIGVRASRRHTTPEHIVSHFARHALVIAFDQSFSRGKPVLAQLRDKVRRVRDLEGDAFYYSSHASFLFAAPNASELDRVRDVLRHRGLPESRIVD
jgi:hypothetical protein